MACAKSRISVATKSATGRFCLCPAVRITRPLASSRPRPTLLNALHMPNNTSSMASDGDVPLVTRRVLFITLPMAPVLLRALKARADEPGNGFKKFVGYNMQPDLYLGYGKTVNMEPMYTFEYPAEWLEDDVTKTEKSTMGMDGRVVHPKRAKEKAFVIALGGKDYQDARMVNLKQTMDAFAGGDYDLREALTDATDLKQTEGKVNGREVYYYDIQSDKRRYLSTISMKDGTMYALFVTAPPAAFNKDEQGLRHIQETFTLL